MSVANPPFPNEYTLRTVAEVSSKPCFICHKPTTKVLTTVGNKDFLYICPSHLKDPGFASPILDPATEAARLKAETLQREKEAVIAEYEERMRKKRGWWKNMISGGGSSGDGEAEKKKKVDEQKSEEGREEREKDEKLKAIDAKAAASGTTVNDEGPRQFTLHRNFYQMRIDKKQAIERAKREQSRLQDPTFFPAAPKGDVK